MSNPAQIYHALHAPVAPYTWEVRADLLSTEESTGRIPFSFLRPVEIVGFLPVVTVLLPEQGGGLQFPSTRDIDVQLDLNNEERFTNRMGTGAATGAASSSHVSLAALSSAVEDGGTRLVRIQGRNAAPDFGVTFAWRQFLQGTPFFENARISLAFYARYLTAAELRD